MDAALSQALRGKSVTPQSRASLLNRLQCVLMSISNVKKGLSSRHLTGRLTSSTQNAVYFYGIK
jgi:hypothetical protein